MRKAAPFLAVTLGLVLIPVLVFGFDITGLTVDPPCFNPNETSTDISFSLTDDATVSVLVKDAGDAVIKTIIEEEALTAGLHSYEWDGTPDLRAFVADGSYTILVEAIFADGSVDVLSFAPTADITDPVALTYFDGKVYVADFAGLKVRIYDEAGTFVSEHSTSPEGPVDVALDSSGNIYVLTSGYDGRVYKFNSSWGNEQIIIDSALIGGWYPGTTMKIYNDQIYIAATWNPHYFLKFDLSGNPLGSTEVSNGGWIYTGMDIDSTGDIWLAVENDSSDGSIDHYNSSYAYQGSWLLSGTTNNPLDVAVKDDTFIYVQGDTTISLFDRAGEEVNSFSNYPGGGYKVGLDFGNGFLFAVCDNYPNYRLARYLDESGLYLENSEATVDTTNPIATITSPIDDQTIDGNVQTTFDVLGTADDVNFSEYVLEYEAVAEKTWEEIQTGSAPVVSGTLGTWDLASLSSGDYSLRLTVTDLADNTEEFQISVTWIEPSGDDDDSTDDDTTDDDTADDDTTDDDSADDDVADDDSTDDDSSDDDASDDDLSDDDQDSDDEGDDNGNACGC